MSSLKAIKKRAFEDLFEMASGYVLDFSNNTFAEFFRETAKIDIYAPKYDFNGDSKAKRLRAFWESEPDALVGKMFIDVAHGLGALKLDVKKFSHELRDFRNYIHPYQQLASKFTTDKHTAEICLQVLKADLADLSGGRK